LKPKSKRTQHEEMMHFNEGAAYIILAQPKMYPGLPVEWALRWEAKHGKANPKADNFMRRISEKDPTSLEAKYQKKARDRVSAARRAWMKKKWKISRQGNPYTETRDNIRAVTWKTKAGWHYTVVNTLTEETRRSQEIYPDAERAKSEAFDAMVYLKSKSVSAHPSLLVSQPTYS
jgi:hypothetical protein